MEEKFRVELEDTSMEEYKEEEFYETIEAPKFVDFTRPNHFCPDDRYWFCSRVGCNLNHEEEMDSDAIYKDFVIRVMAARSPNVKFQRALSRKNPSESKRCPMSAPPKSSKSRLPRLALTSSISRKLIDDEKGTAKSSPTKPVLTPIARVKHVPAKYMTSPRKKKGGSPKMNGFRSVRNPKKTSITIQKNKVVSKALVFNSPKKVKRVKDFELATPITKLCEGVKKLEITSNKKGLSQKPAKECRSIRKLLPSDASRKQAGSMKIKTQQDDLSCSRRCKGQSTKSIRPVKGKAKQNDKKHGDGVLHELRPGDDTSDMEVDEKSRAGSLDLCPTTVTSTTEEQTEGASPNAACGTSQKESTSSLDRPLTAGSSDGISTRTLLSELISADSENSSLPIVKPQADEVTKEKKGNTAENDLENQSPAVLGELMDNDDKENALNSDNNRSINAGSLSKHKALVKRKVTATHKQQKVEKTMIENCPAVVTQGVKYKKLKPTNPKPFRLRTDERGILKEATLEKKIYLQENSANTSENLQSTGNGAPENREKGGKKAADRSLKDQFKPIKSKYKIISKDVEQKSDRGLAPSSEKSSGRTKPLFPHKPVKLQRETNSQPNPRGHNVIEATAATMSTPKESRQQPGKEVPNPTNKGSVTHNTAAKGRRAVTVPREPNFHSLHKPKSCTRNILGH